MKESHKVCPQICPITTMQLLYISTFLFGIFIQCVDSAVQPRLTIITLHERELVTWEVAHNTCMANGQSLLTIKTPEKKHIISDLDRKHYNSHMYDTQYWIGMRKAGPSFPNCSNADFIWVDNGSKVDWGEYYPGEPNDCDFEDCIRIQNLLLRTRGCEILYYFICEEVLDECTFETFNSSIMTQENLLLIPSQVLTMETNSKKASCLETCLDTAVDGAFCQAVMVNVTSCECVLFFSNFTAFGEIRMVPDPDQVTYVKQCFLVSNESTTSVSYEDVCPGPASTCSTLVSMDTILTTPVATTSADVTTTSTSSSEPSTIISTCPTNQDTSSTTQASSLLPTSGLSLAMNTSSCAINVSWELLPNVDMQSIMKSVVELKRELEILKNSTNMYKRGKVSWHDNRTSSKSLGGLGVSFLAIFCLLVIIVDIISFRKRNEIMSEFA